MPTTEAGKRLQADIREMAGVIHQTDSLRSHADPNDKTGWNLGPIETCEDPYCVEGRDASAAIAAIEAEAAIAALDALAADVAELPQGTRIRRHRYTDEEGNPRTDYDRPASIVNDGRISRAAVLAAIAKAYREDTDATD